MSSRSLDFALMLYATTYGLASSFVLADVFSRRPPGRTNSGYHASLNADQVCGTVQPVTCSNHPPCFFSPFETPPLARSSATCRLNSSQKSLPFAMDPAVELLVYWERSDSWGTTYAFRLLTPPLSAQAYQVCRLLLSLKRQYEA